MDILQLFTLYILALRVWALGVQSSSHCSKDVPCDVNEDELLYEDPFLARRDPGEVGDVTEEDLGNGSTQTVITRSVDPPIFELPNFLSEEECDHIRHAAKDKMEDSQVMRGVPVKDDKMRISKTTFLSGVNDKTLRNIMDRASILSGLSRTLVYDTNTFQVGYYGVGGFYNFHTDSTITHEATRFERPCCNKYTKTGSTSTCSICRYITILMYLNDVEEGGETAFPLADSTGHSIPDKFEFFDMLCESAPVVVSPAKGNAVMWYNNIVDPEYGWLGVVDAKSVHGGCPVVKGEKWVSNLWIGAPPYNALPKKVKLP